MKKKTLATIVCALIPAGAALGQDLYLSVAANLDTEVAGVPFADGDILKTDPAGSAASIAIAESVLGSGVDIDGMHMMPNGHWLFSALFNNLSFNGPTSYLDGDIAEYDPVSGTHSLFFSEALFESSGADISGISMTAGGNLLFSTLGDNSLAGTAMTDGDIVEWDGTNASILLAETDLFDDGDGDVYGFHMMDDGTFLISASDDEMISGTQFSDGDIFQYDPVADTASLFFSEDTFGGPNDDDIDGLYYVPEPGALALLALGALAVRRRR